MNELLDNFINWNEKDFNKLEHIVNQKYSKITPHNWDYFRNIGCIVKFENEPNAREKTPNSVRVIIPVAGGFMVRCYYIDIPFVVANRLLKGEYDEC